MKIDKKVSVCKRNREVGTLVNLKKSANFISKEI